MNDPINYIDPSGHILKAIGNAVVSAAKTVANVVVKAATTVATVAVSAAKTVANVAVSVVSTVANAFSTNVVQPAVTWINGTAVPAVKAGVSTAVNYAADMMIHASGLAFYSSQQAKQYFSDNAQTLVAAINKVFCSGDMQRIGSGVGTAKPGSVSLLNTAFMIK